MRDDRLEEELRRALERPALASPQPAQARYRRTRPASGRRGWVGPAAALSAGAVAAGLILAAGTGSANPRVWTIRAASVVTRLEGRTAPSPEASPSATPSARPPVVTVTPSAQPLPKSPEPSPEPSEKPGEVESTGGGGSGSADSTGDRSGDRSGDPSPSPTASPSPGSDG